MMKFDALVLPLLQKRLYKASFWICLIFFEIWGFLTRILSKMYLWLGTKMKLFWMRLTEWRIYFTRNKGLTCKGKMIEVVKMLNLWSIPVFWLLKKLRSSSKFVKKTFILEMANKESCLTSFFWIPNFFLQTKNARSQSSERAPCILRIKSISRKSVPICRLPRRTRRSAGTCPFGQSSWATWGRWRRR